jgi:hypothetical protein
VIAEVPLRCIPRITTDPFDERLTIWFVCVFTLPLPSEMRHLLQKSFGPKQSLIAEKRHDAAERRLRTCIAASAVR